MSELISIVSSPTLEKWDFRSPEKGIGGSETSHVRMAQELYRRGYSVNSHAPLPDGGISHLDPTGVLWYQPGDWAPESKILINYRDPKIFDRDKWPGAKWWFIAQDTDYVTAWTPERLEKVDRYITLCPTHAAYTKGRYPVLHDSGRLYVSSNGIESAAIQTAISGIERNPKRLMYASSPDRGLMLLLENWFRIRERVHDAELHVFYGFQNYKKIIELNGPTDWRNSHMAELESLMKQPGVTWHDRVGQKELWQEWAKSNIWFYPTEFAETSCITSMEAQACGAIPVVTNFWALKSNIIDGYKFDGLPQKSDVVKGLMIEKVVELLNDSSEWDESEYQTDYAGMSWKDPARRIEMQNFARERFNWSVIADQWEGWIREDLGIPPKANRLILPEPTDDMMKAGIRLMTSCCPPFNGTGKLFYGTALPPDFDLTKDTEYR